MRERSAISLFAACGALLLSTGAHAATLTKAPDLGDYWHPLSSWGTNVYADSFIAPVTGSVTDLGTWLNGGSSSLVFEILADAGDAPDGATILGSTAVLSYTTDTLTFEHAVPSTDITLIAGQRYWFAASTVGLGGSGGYDVGGHSQNSGGIIDDGSFWYSNDAAGLGFDGQSQTPEMAFSVSISAVPEPAPALLLGVGLLALGLAARRRASAPASLGQRIRSGSHP